MKLTMKNMKLYKPYYIQLVSVLILLILVRCNTNEDKKPKLIDVDVLIENIKDEVQPVVQKETPSLPEGLKIDTMSVMFVPCSNGYDFAQANMDLDRIIEEELNKFQNINIKPFPYKTLMGVAYYGVFDKKYCAPIIEKVDVDFLILTKFDEIFNDLGRPKNKWGYEVRIIDTETLEQVNSISAHKLKNYQQIEKHIKDNIEKLKMDIEKIK